MRFKMRAELFLPWISLLWGISSAFLITHNSTGIYKFLFFSGLFALAVLASIALPRGRFKFFDWLHLISQQSSAQYILFFSLPLLWKAESHAWLAVTLVTALSTLWDPYFNKLWENDWYRRWILLICLILLSALITIAFKPTLLHWGVWILVLNCLLAHVMIILSLLQKDAKQTAHRQKTRNIQKLFLRDSWTMAVLFLGIIVTLSPLPPLGIFVSEGRLTAQPEDQSMTCETKIAAPSGFHSEVIHRWEFEGFPTGADDVILPEVKGNGIDGKPFRTESRKQVFPATFEQVRLKRIRCSVVLPTVGLIGSVSND